MTNDRVFSPAKHENFRSANEREHDGFMAEVAELGSKIEIRELAKPVSAAHEIEETMHMGAFGV